MGREVDEPQPKRQTRLLISGVGLFLAGVAMVLLLLLGDTTGSERWFRLTISGILALIGAIQMGDVIRDRRRFRHTSRRDHEGFSSDTTGD